ncbi:MAG: hypothetical protein M3Q10_10865, partial [Chloroflexota bacterium]|nr:hypothetical protein [Chloroflexota bacterium]
MSIPADPKPPTVPATPGPPATPVAPLPRPGRALVLATLGGLAVFGLAVFYILGGDRSDEMVRLGYVFVIASLAVLIYGAVVSVAAMLDPRKAASGE